MALKKIKLTHNTSEWLEFRQTGIGASEAAAILGMSNFKNNIELWEEKVGLRNPQDISDNERVRYGTDAESPLIELFKLQYADKYIVKVDKSVVYQRNGFQFASLDGELTEIASGDLGIYEGKTVVASSHRVWEEWKDQIPQNYYIQLLHQLLVTGRKFNVIAPEFRWIDKEGEIATKCQRYRINASEVQADMKLLDEAEHEFWECVKRKTRPALVLPQI